MSQARFIFSRNLLGGRRSALLRCASVALLLCVAQVAHAADLSKDIRSAPDATAYAAAIHQYIQGQLAIINQDDDPKKTSGARESLVDEVRGLTPPSTSFLNIYCTELQSLVPPIASNANIRVRLNVAIVVSKVATAAQDARLAPLVITELNDSNQAVVIWGLRAAHDVIPPALNVAFLKGQLVGAVSKAAQKFNSGDIIGGAYYALATDPSLVVPVQDLLNWRIGQYAAGIPAEPPADSRATDFLTQRNVWLAESPAQQKATVQLIADLIGVSASNFSAAGPEDRDELARLLVGVAEAIDVIGLTTANAPLSQAAKPLEATTSRTPPEAVLSTSATAVSALAMKFTGLHMPKAFGTSATSPSPIPSPSTPSPAKPAP